MAKLHWKYKISLFLKPTTMALRIKEGRPCLQCLLLAGTSMYCFTLLVTLMPYQPVDFTNVNQVEGKQDDRFYSLIKKNDTTGGHNHEVLSNFESKTVRIKNPTHNLNKSTSLTMSQSNSPSKFNKSMQIKEPTYQLVIDQAFLCHQVEEDEEDTSLSQSLGNQKAMKVHLLIMVHSHPSHRRRRNAIRETWGKVVRQYDNENKHVVLVFVLGLPTDYDEYQSVKKEARLYLDTIVWDFQDTYRNLTIKSLLGFYWASASCSMAEFVMKCDDDVYLNLPLLLSILSRYKPRNLILGSLNSESPVRRYGQWQLNRQQYADSMFPPYCSGCAYVLSGDLVPKLYSKSGMNQESNVLPVEDVYVTGILAKVLGIMCQHHEQFPIWITVPSVMNLQRFLSDKLVGIHGVDWIRMHSISEMIQNCETCSYNAAETKQWLSRIMDMDAMYK